MSSVISKTTRSRSTAADTGADTTWSAPSFWANASPWVRWVLSALAALVPLSLVIHGQIKAIPPALLFFAGLYLVATRREVRADYCRVWPVMVCAGLTIIYAIANTLGHGLGASALGGAGHVLLYMVIAAVFAATVDMRVVRTGFSLTAIGLGVFCIVQHFGMGVERAYSLDGGASTSIELAEVMLGLALMALVQLLRGRRSRPAWWLHGAAVVLGVYGALLTQSRGPLLAFVPIFLGLLVFKAKRSGRWRWCLSGVAIFVVGGAIAVASLHGATLQRFSHIDQQFAVASTGRVDGSVSARLEMWRTAARAFNAHPWTGLGIDRFQQYIRKEVAAGHADAAIEQYNNPHDMYLGAAVAGGVPGLLVLLAMFVVPLGFFAYHIRSDDTPTATAAWSGLAIVVLYMLCALTDSIFYRVMTQSFYFLLVLGFSMQIARRSRANASDGMG